MNLRLFSYVILGSGLIILLYLGIRADFTLLTAQRSPALPRTQQVQAQPTPAPGDPQVRAGTPVEVAENPLLPSKRYQATHSITDPAIVVTDTVTGDIVLLGEEPGGAQWIGQSDTYLLWTFSCSAGCPTLVPGFYAYSFATQQNIHLLPYSVWFAETRGDWVVYLLDDTPHSHNAQLYAINIQSQERITLSHNAWLDFAYPTFGIGEHFVVWHNVTFSAPSTIEVYDLQQRQRIASIDPDQIGRQGGSLFDFGIGDTVITWSRNYAYDLVTNSYFTFTVKPSDWVPRPIAESTIPTEYDRALYYSMMLTDSSTYHFRTPILDATPSMEPCVTDQNLVANGDFENVDAHGLWQQQGNIANLLINDPPPGLATSGDWALRLGRFADNQASIQQQLDIPSAVKELTLTFDVRVHSWDLWGGDQLQIDLVDPLTGNSVLATPATWTNVELASHHSCFSSVPSRPLLSHRFHRG